MKVAFSLLILFAAIQTYAVSSIDPLKVKLDGRWEWVVTSGGYAGEIYTPQSVHYSLTLVFSKNVPQLGSDSIGYQVYRSDTLILSGITAITLSNMPAFGPGNRIKGTVHISSDTLSLSTFISDGYSSIFIRPTTALKRDRPLARVRMRSSPFDRPLKQFTLSGRRINASRHCAHPAQITVKNGPALQLLPLKLLSKDNEK